MSTGSNEQQNYSKLVAHVCKMKTSMNNIWQYKYEHAIIHSWIILISTIKYQLMKIANDLVNTWTDMTESWAIGGHNYIKCKIISQEKFILKGVKQACKTVNPLRLIIQSLQQHKAPEKILLLNTSSRDTLLWRYWWAPMSGYVENSQKAAGAINKTLPIIKYASRQYLHLISGMINLKAEKMKWKYHPLKQLLRPVTGADWI